MGGAGRPGTREAATATSNARAAALTSNGTRAATSPAAAADGGGAGEASADPRRRGRPPGRSSPSGPNDPPESTLRRPGRAPRGRKYRQTAALREGKAGQARPGAAAGGVAAGTDFGSPGSQFSGIPLATGYRIR